jgi:hypothetical protein
LDQDGVIAAIGAFLAEQPAAQGRKKAGAKL